MVHSPGFYGLRLYLFMIIDLSYFHLTASEHSISIIWVLDSPSQKIAFMNFKKIVPINLKLRIDHCG